MSTMEELDLGSSVAVNWSYPSQEIREHVSPGSWSSAAHPGYATWEEFGEQGEITMLVPADQNRYLAGWRAGRFELLNEPQAKLNEIGDEAHRTDRR
ncbi:hypothetical protein FE391_35535 [Nonomuraea sp. KC401]|uniref:hypothetical protein n=1 Tax=unclassified Nonomuraea TaxID=2593643 RepID=UPI0010FD6ED3|nr:MULTISPECIES: hypothetical protein [unclassified Nonomuraea]NBE99285.1 hypothetical protein [Nonomuraea sp. K271]TLF58975.1 hypothetical protein FE391_35535 [Nonomuraea sp. KC401]